MRLVCVPQTRAKEQGKKITNPMHLASGWQNPEERIVDTDFIGSYQGVDYCRTRKKHGGDTVKHGPDTVKKHFL